MAKNIYDTKKKQSSGFDRTVFSRRASALKKEGMRWYPAWKDLTTYINPTRGYFYDETPNKSKEIDHVTLIDSHAKRAVRDSASGMMSGFTSPSRPWFKIETPDLDLNEFAPVKLQLDEITRRMMTIMSTSNSYDMHYSIYEEILSFGTACGAVVEDFQDVIRGRNFTIGEYFLGFDGAGRLNAFHRKIWKTVGQLVADFGIDNVSASVKSAYGSNRLDQWKTINHLIEENDDRVSLFKDFKNMAYRSVYWEDNEKDKQFLRVGGYEEMPILAPRWHTVTSSDYYGVAPGWDILGDVKMLQKEQKDKLLGIEKGVNPPMQSDASVEGDINTLPGGITRFSANLPNAGLKPAYQVNPDINGIRQDILEIKTAISEALYANLFRMMVELDRGSITATEIAERQAEKLSLLAPFTEKLNNEYLNHYITRVFNICLRAGLFPQFPPEMQGMDLRIKYVSLMAQAQKMVGVTALENTMAFAGKLAEVNSSVLHNINFDETYRTYVDMMGIPAKTSNSPEQVAQIRKAEEEKQAQIEQAQKMAVAADAAAKGGKAIKDAASAPMGTDSALDGLMDSVKELNK